MLMPIVLNDRKDKVSFIAYISCNIAVRAKVIISYKRITIYGKVGCDRSWQQGLQIS